MLPISTLRGPIGVHQLSADQRAHGAGDQHGRQRGVARALAGAELGHEPQRHECLEAEVHPGADAPRCCPGRRTAPTGRARRTPLAATAALRAASRPCRCGRPRTKHDGHDRRQHHQAQRPGQPEDQHQRGGQQRPESEAHVAAHREHAHAAPASGARGDAGVARTLGVEGGHTDAADGDRGDGERVGVQQAHHGQPGARGEHTRGHQPRLAHAVGQQPEQRLDQRRADRGRQHQRAEGGERVAALGGQEGQQRGHGALAHVGARVGQPQQRQAAPVQRSVVAVHPHQRDSGVR